MPAACFDADSASDSDRWNSSAIEPKWSRPARFAGVRDEFERNFAERGEVGASVCVTVDGRRFQTLTKAAAKRWGLKALRWTSVISVSQLLIAARRTNQARLMQDVVRLVAAVKVAPFDVLAAQAFAKFRATESATDPDDAMVAAVAVTGDYTLVTRRESAFARFPNLRTEDWVG